MIEYLKLSVLSNSANFCVLVRDNVWLTCGQKVTQVFLHGLGQSAELRVLNANQSARMQNLRGSSRYKVREMDPQYLQLNEGSLK